MSSRNVEKRGIFSPWRASRVVITISTSVWSYTASPGSGFPLVMSDSNTRGMHKTRVARTVAGYALLLRQRRVYDACVLRLTHRHLGATSAALIATVRASRYAYLCNRYG